ncbi:MAG: serine acetyltransferase [Bacteroidales bacterium]|nr:serine acetyltransferase [Bacteroidales bacterium]
MKSVKATAKGLTEMMDAVKDAVFPEYSDQNTSNAPRRIHRALSSLAGELVADKFIETLPEIKRLLQTDVEAIEANDPAATGQREIVFCYPAVKAILYYRTAHRLWELKVPILPRMLTEYAHSVTGIDIHPGASIGEYFAIDHGTGTVIGETAIIGNHVTLYQGVTLGAKNFVYDESGRPRNVLRHPIIEDNVTVYSNASLLGRITIGKGSVIGGNVWLTHSVPPQSRILQSPSRELFFTGGEGI